MLVVVRDGGRERELDVELRTPEATLRDLVEAVGGDPGRPAVVLDGRRLALDRLVADVALQAGGVLDLDAGAAFVPAAQAAAQAAAQSAPQAAAGPYEVAVVSGPDAGATGPLLPVTVVGRGPGADVHLDAPSVSREHGQLRRGPDGRVTWHDPAGRSRVDDAPVAGGVELPPGAVLRLPGADLVVRPAERSDRSVLAGAGLPGPAGTRPFNRPPRSAPPAVPAPLQLPEPPVDRPAEPFSWASLVGPLVLAGVLVAVTHDPRYALFSALTPLLAVGTWWEGRRRRRVHGRREAAAHAGALADLAAAVRDASAQQRAALRDVAPDPAEVLRRALLPSSRLWERRPGDADLLRLGVGTADQPWTVPLAAGPAPPADVREVLAGARLSAAPVVVELGGGGVLGVAGDRTASLAAVRTLVCAAAVTVGPADLALVVVSAATHADAWRWCCWLPHARLAAGGRSVVSGRAGAAELVRSLPPGPVLLVVDGPELLHGKDAPVRELLAGGSRAGRVGAVVLAPTREALPAACDQVLAVAADGHGTLTRRAGDDVPSVLVAGLAPERALRCARALGRHEDPELAGAGAGLPAVVRLLPLLELAGPGGAPDPRLLLQRWQAAGPDPGARAPIGVTETGLLVLDLARDGPHALVAGTTGAGKSELLRTLVAGLAASAGPQSLTFLLVDYKGGAAFDACARLPHVVGLVTDLDERLGERALRALDAELHARERTLRAAGAADLPAYLALGLPEALPRLVVVVDEFATLAAELPGFVSSLVSVAQRGRTLGVHLVLATQRPSGAVSDDIRANTNLRVALRVQDPADSSDVLGSPVAAALGRERPGRAYVRLGPGELVPLQTALVSCRSGPGDASPVRAVPLGAAGPTPEPAGPGGTGADGTGPTDLERLVDAAVAAFLASGMPEPRRPWPEPLPTELALDLTGPGHAPGTPGAEGDDDTVHVAVADDPAHQCRSPAGWDLRQGGLLLVGVPGSGTTTALRALALALAAGRPPDRLELYALDAGAGGLADLADLPHTGAVVAAGDPERRDRLLRDLGRELDRRRALPPGAALRRTVLLVDGLAALRGELDDAEGLALLDVLARLHADGPALGISVALTADRLSAVPPALAAVTTQTWLFRLADPYDYAAAGLAPADRPAPLPGRAVLLPSRLQAQVGRPGPDAVAEVAVRWPGHDRAARPVRALPGVVRPVDLGRTARVHREVLTVPVGLRSDDLGVAELVLHPGDHVLVAGPGRSGRSGVLAALAAVLAPAGVPVAACAPRRSPLSRCGDVPRCVTPDRLPGLLEELAGDAGGRPVVLLVDDADAVDDPGGALEALLRRPEPGVVVVASGRTDALRAAYGHWTTVLRRSRTGLLLRPAVDLDGDLLGVALPRRSPVPAGAARGYLVVDGRAVLVQAATTTADAG